MSKPKRDTTSAGLPAVQNSEQIQLSTIVPKRNKRTCCAKFLVLFAMIVLAAVYLKTNPTGHLI